MIPAIVGVPIKPFGVAKQRLASVLDAKQRSTLGRTVAARTTSMIALSGARPIVVTSDDGVARWAKSLHLDVLPEQLAAPPGLDRAAHSVAGAARNEAWAVVHADLPLATEADFEAAWAALDSRPGVVAPAHDCGTNLIAASGSLDFSYGAGSFIRHLRRLSGAAVVTRPGLAHDLDTPHDLAVMRSLRSGRWLRSVLEVIEASPGGS